MWPTREVAAIRSEIAFDDLRVVEVELKLEVRRADLRADRVRPACVETGSSGASRGLRASISTLTLCACASPHAKQVPDERGALAGAAVVVGAFGHDPAMQ
jgi:hypothetical protein